MWLLISSMIAIYWERSSWLKSGNQQQNLRRWLLTYGNLRSWVTVFGPRLMASCTECSFPSLLNCCLRVQRLRMSNLFYFLHGLTLPLPAMTRFILWAPPLLQVSLALLFSCAVVCLRARCSETYSLLKGYHTHGPKWFPVLSLHTARTFPVYTCHTKTFHHMSDMHVSCNAVIIVRVLVIFILYTIMFLHFLGSISQHK